MNVQKLEGIQTVERETFVVGLEHLNGQQIALAGGKAANLGELIQAGFPVPAGFCVTTAAYKQVSAMLAPLLTELGRVPLKDTQRKAELSTLLRKTLEEAPIPTEIIEEISNAYEALSKDEPVAVAVRSSATAEDLSYASFAGQQESYLNIIGKDAVIKAVKHCWASLWTERSISYRENLSLDHQSVRLAVVVQRLVEPQTAGVLFTANPLTGKRRQAVIDANPGLGEAVVSGATNPDHFVVNSTNGEIIERHISTKRVVIRSTAGGGTIRTEGKDEDGAACLSDEQARALAALGVQVEKHYEAPQDIEWVFDAMGKIWLTQSRAITTLFPLPENAPDSDEQLRAYFSFNVLQGVYQPLTPIGISTFRFFASSAMNAFHLTRKKQRGDPKFLVDAASRLFVDITFASRHAPGRKLLMGAAEIAEKRSGAIFQELFTDPRLSLLRTSAWPTIRGFGMLFAHTRLPLYMLQAILRPQATVIGIKRLREKLQAEGQTQVGKNAVEQLADFKQAFPGLAGSIIGHNMAALFVGMGAYVLEGKLLGQLATTEELQTVLRGLPHNPTTEMGLTLWSLAQRIQTDPEALHIVRETTPEQMEIDYMTGKLPATLQQGLTEFLSVYGHRGVAEIDVGVSRWGENPVHILMQYPQSGPQNVESSVRLPNSLHPQRVYPTIPKMSSGFVLGMLVNYVQQENPELAADIQFQRGAEEAEAMVAELTRRAMRQNWLKGLFVSFCFKRTRMLAGFREMPKFCLVMLIAKMRALLWPIGKELEQAERLADASDIFFIGYQEIDEAIAGKDMRLVVSERRANYEREWQRRRIPRVLLSDGTEPGLLTHTQNMTGKQLRGTSASPGQVTARARVIFDPTSTHLEPGEVLVAPSTDPGWTPLFLTASALVMEMGGMMSHGAVVAREYGIPAIVGVEGATERIVNGAMITVDGTKGIVTISKE